MQITGRSGLATLTPSGREGVAEVERVAGVYVGLWVGDLVVGAGVVAELGDVPDYEGVFRYAVLDCFEDRVLRLLEPDVVVGNEVAGRGHRFGGRRTLSGPGLDEVGKQRLDGGFCVAVQGNGVSLDSCKFTVVYVDVHERGRFARGIAQRKTRADPYHHVGGLHHIEELVHVPVSPREG